MKSLESQTENEGSRSGIRTHSGLAESSDNLGKNSASESTSYTPATSPSDSCVSSEAYAGHSVPEAQSVGPDSTCGSPDKRESTAESERIAELEAENLELRGQLQIHVKANCAAKLGRARAELRHLRELEALVRADLMRAGKADRDLADARGKTFKVLNALDGMRIQQRSETDSNAPKESL